MKVLSVCGFGVGSSMVLKMTLDKVFKELDVDADVETADLSSAKGARVDAIFTSTELAKDLEASTNAPIYPIKKYMDKEEVKKSVKELLKKKNS